MSILSSLQSNQSPKRLVLVGGQRHALVVYSIAQNQFEQIAYGGFARNRDLDALSVPYLGLDNDILELDPKHHILHLCSGDLRIRSEQFALFQSHAFEFVTIQSPLASVAPSAQLAQGCFINHHALIQVQSEIGQCCIINSGAIIEHHCQIGSFCHVAPGSILCGSVRIGAQTMVGAGTTIIPDCCIGSNCTIGAGSVVTRDLDDNSKAFGNPCRIKGNNESLPHST